MSSENGALRVIVADDDPDIRALVAIAVRKSGLQLIDSLEDGESAWHSIQLHRPDVVLLDVAMPGMTGVDVCREVRASDLAGSIRILLISAAVDDASEAAGIHAGADEYLFKPFSPRDLVGRLSELTTRVRTR